MKVRVRWSATPRNWPELLGKLRHEWPTIRATIASYPTESEPGALDIEGSLDGIVRFLKREFELSDEEALGQLILLTRDERELPYDERLDAVSGFIGEGVHTAFRRVGDSPQADAAWTAIHDMPADEWRATLRFVVVPLIARWHELVGRR